MAKLPAGATIESSGGVKLPAGATIEAPEETAETKDSYFRGLTQQVAQGVSLGFSDEITAALTAIPAAISSALI